MTDNNDPRNRLFVSWLYSSMSHVLQTQYNHQFIFISCIYRLDKQVGTIFEIANLNLAAKLNLINTSNLANNRIFNKTLSFRPILLWFSSLAVKIRSCWCWRLMMKWRNNMRNLEATNTRCIRRDENPRINLTMTMSLRLAHVMTWSNMHWQWSSV